jgi:hypothetical protein
MEAFARSIGGMQHPVNLIAGIRVDGSEHGYYDIIIFVFVAILINSKKRNPIHEFC